MSGVLAGVRTLVRRSAESRDGLEDYAGHLDARLSAFARVQALLLREGEGGVNLDYLVVEELLAHGAREGESVRVSGPAIRLSPKAAEALGLALHELAINAVKFGALSQGGGRVEVRWRVSRSGADAHLLIEWSESGGPPAVRPSHRGFGMMMLEQSLASDLGAEVETRFAGEGFSCTLRLPLQDLIVVPSTGSVP